MSRFHRSLAEMPAVFVNNRAESLLGQENLGSSVELPGGTIPVYSWAAQSCSWKRRPCLQKLSPEPLLDVITAEGSFVWRPVLYSWKWERDFEKGIVVSPLFAFGWKVTGRVKCYHSERVLPCLSSRQRHQSLHDPEEHRRTSAQAWYGKQNSV